MTTGLSVMVTTLSVLAVICYVLDYFVFRKGILNLPSPIKKLLANFITFALFFFAYCLLELYLCAMLEI